MDFSFDISPKNPSQFCRAKEKCRVYVFGLCQIFLIKILISWKTFKSFSSSFSENLFRNSIWLRCIEILLKKYSDNFPEDFICFIREYLATFGCSYSAFSLHGRIHMSHRVTNSWKSREILLQKLGIFYLTEKFQYFLPLLHALSTKIWSSTFDFLNFRFFQSRICDKTIFVRSIFMRNYVREEKRLKRQGISKSTKTCYLPC